MEEYLLKEKVITEKELSTIKKRLEKEMADAVSFAKESPEPELEVLYEDIFAE